MKVAAFSDAHGNAFAAEAVLRDIAAHAPDLTVNLGDQVWGQANPMRALELQRGLGAVEVRGNNDELLGVDPANLPPHKQAVGRWLAQQLPQPERERLTALPLTATLAGDEVLASHGTPSSPFHSLLLHFDSDTGITRRRSETEIAQRLAGFEGWRVYIVSHMHRADTRRLGETLLVNVGPVNWPNDGDPRAAWCLLERRGGRWHATHKRVTYDWHAAARWIEQSSAPDKAETELMLRPANDMLRLQQREPRRVKLPA